MQKLQTDLGSASEWSWLKENLHQPIRSTSQILASDMSSVWSFCVCLAGKLGRRLSNHTIIAEILRFSSFFAKGSITLVNLRAIF